MQNYLAHHGIVGQRKGIRRFQNEDGSLTLAGKEHYGEWNPGKRKKTALKEVRNKNGSYRYNIESEDGSTVGNISTYHQSDDSLRVSWISVDKDHKREGYASGAMDTLFDQAKEKGYKKVTVVIPKDDANVQHIYERLGFKPSNDGLTNDEVADSITSLGEVVKMEYELEHSDTLDDVLDDYLMHYGVGPDDNPPGRGSGRYPKGSGERPYQHDENKDAGEKKRGGLFSIFKKKESDNSDDGKPRERKLAEQNFEKYKESLATARANWDKISRQKHGTVYGDVDIAAPEVREAKREYDRLATEAAKEILPNADEASLEQVSQWLHYLATREFSDNKDKYLNLKPKEIPKFGKQQDAKSMMDALDDFYKKYRERPDHDVSEEREQIFDKIESGWLSTSSGSQKLSERMRSNPEFKERVISATDLGLKGLDEMRGPGYIDWKEFKEQPKYQREWFIVEDQTIGMLPIADLVNKGYSGEQVGKLIDFIDEEGGYLQVSSNSPGYGCYSDVKNGWADELKPFARACERAKNKEINHSDLLDDFLAHYGVGPDDNPPGRGSGRYAKGTGENPYQHDDAKRAQMKKRGLFGSIQTALAKRKANTEIDKYSNYVHGMLNGSLKNDKTLHEKYKKLIERTDGKLSFLPNGDPSYDGADDDREKLAAEWKKFSEEVVDKHAKAEARSENLKKARETKAANKAKAEKEQRTKEELEAAKAKAIASGDPEQISKWLSKMSNQEQIDAINRIKNTQDIKDRAAAQAKARQDEMIAREEANRPKTKKELRDEKLKEGFETAKNVIDKADEVRQMAEKGIKIWNVIAAVNNAANKDFKLPKVDLNSGEKKKDKDKEENKENKDNKNQNKNQQNNSGSTTNTNSNNTTYNTTNNYYNGEKKEESKVDAETARKAAADYDGDTIYDWYDAPYKYEEAGKLLLEDFMKRKK